MLDPLIQQLTQELEMEDFINRTESGSYHLIFENNVSIDLSQTTQGYLFKAFIGDCPTDNIELFLVKLLEANLFGRGTRGASLGINEEGKLLTLSLELDYNSTYKGFRDKLEDFVNVLEFWRQEALKHQ